MVRSKWARLGRALMLAGMVWLSGQTASAAERTAAMNDVVAGLLTQLNVPDRFAGHVPDFAVEQRDLQCMGPNGPYTETVHLITDHGKLVAIYSGRPQIRVMPVTPHTAQPLADWVPPVRYHNATTTGARMTTIPWLTAWAYTGTEKGHRFEGGGKTLTFVEWQRWAPGNPTGATGYAEYRFTFDVDPKLGYVVRGDFVVQLDQRPIKKGQPISKFEYTNLLNGEMSRVWPGEWRYDRTAYTPADGDKFAGHAFAGWFNNVFAAELSDDRPVKLRSGGFISFIDDDDWSPALSTFADYAPSLQTCNVWQDQHNHLSFPDEPNHPNGYELRWTSRFQYLPPELSRHIADTMAMDDFGGRREVMIRIGQTEDFEDQPLPLATTRTRGISGHGLRIGTDVARSGSRSLVYTAGNPEGEKSHYRNRGEFLFLPQITLQAGHRYRIEAYARVTEPDTTARITADLYEWTPHDPARLKQQETNAAATPNEWVLIELDFTAPNYDAYLDLRFMQSGKGKVYYDDFKLEDLGPAKP